MASIRIDGSGFLQTDPVPGGSANAYDYAGQDPTNTFDLDGRTVVGADGGGGSYKKLGCAELRGRLKRKYEELEKRIDEYNDPVEELPDHGRNSRAGHIRAINDIINTINDLLRQVWRHCKKLRGVDAPQFPHIKGIPEKIRYGVHLPENPFYVGMYDIL